MFCTHCGREIDDDANFCDYCGKSTAEDSVLSSVSPVSTDETKYSMTTANQPVQQVKTKSYTKIAVFIIGGIIAIGVIIVVLILIFTQNYQSDDTIHTVQSSYTEETTETSATTFVTTTKLTTTKAKTTTAAITTTKSVQTYSITFEADELIEEAGLTLGGHVGVAVLSNLTCSNGNANIETETIYIYDSLVRVEVTGAEAGEVVLGGTITTYGLDNNEGETVSYPADSGVFLISKTVGESIADKPYAEGYVETYSLSGHDGSRIRLYLNGDFSYVSVQIQNQEYTSEVEFYSKEDFGDYIEMNFNPFAQPPSVAYVTPYSDSGVAGNTITCDIPTDSSGTIQTGGMSYPVDNMKGQINCHGETVAGFTTDYVVNGGSVGKVRESLGDTWHITAKNACDNYGVTWYELWDSDDGDYYGWVDENYIDFYQK